MAVLYRKYRPQSFSEVIGQQAIVQTLQNAVASQKPAHAYLFTGTRGVGKTTLARLFAKALNCLNQKNGEVCGKCVVCQAVNNGNFLDMVEIDAASNTGVENVRELIEHVRFKPSQGTYKVFIIDEVHMLSKQAFNALLKTLEEPPAHVVFILATTESYKLPATIISRTQRFDFSSISHVEIEKYLSEIIKKEKLKLPEDIVALVTRQAQGSLRDALSILDKVIALGEGTSSGEVKTLLGITDLESHLKLFSFIAHKEAASIPQFFTELSGQGIDFTLFNKDFLEFLRQALLLKITSQTEKIPASKELVDELFSLVQMLSTPSLIKITRLFLRAYKENSSSPNPELPMLLASIEAALDASGLVKNSAPVLDALTELKSETKTTVQKTEEIPKNFEKSQSNIPKLNIEISLDEVKSFWPNVLQKIRVINSPLATLVKNSPMISVENGVITLEVRYLFHKEHLESAKNYALITGAIEEVSGKRPEVSISIKKDEQVEVNPAEALGSVLQVFGGELVE